MSGAQKIFYCTHCDAQFPKWVGQCTQCGKWGTVEASSASASGGTAQKKHRNDVEGAAAATSIALSSVSASEVHRRPTGIGECDRVLGGGIVPGSLILIGGDPGIGKSTLVAQIAAGVNAPVLYVSGEESAQQVKMRLDRMDINDASLQFVSEEHIESVCKTILQLKPALVIIDSIQTVASSSVDAEPGSVNQIKACTVRLLDVAKQSGVPIMIVGHVTKGGELGGPKTLEHIVDVVLYLEGDQHHQFRLLRSVKNRFGATNEVGVFEMQEQGLKEVQNPSAHVLQDRSTSSGSCMTVVSEGQRLFLIEVQALVNKTAFGYPQRKVSGVDLNRLNVLLAVLQRRAGLPLDAYDVYVNVVGGLRWNDPALDAAVCVAIASALADVPVDARTVVWGEVGLGGELRAVSRQKERTAEAKRFGLTAVVAASAVRSIGDALARVVPAQAR